MFSNGILISRFPNVEKITIIESNNYISYISVLFYFSYYNYFNQVNEFYFRKHCYGTFPRQLGEGGGTFAKET